MTKRKVLRSNHVCENSDIEWGPRPTIGHDAGIHWPGRCGVCGLKVFEVYVQADDGALYMAKHGEDYVQVGDEPEGDD